MRLPLNSIAHLLTDAVCAAAVFGPIAASGGDLSLCIVIYNSAAFLTQCLAGLLTDLLTRHERRAAIGLAVCVLGAYAPLPGWAAALIIGLGNCLFHVAAGTVTLKESRSAGPLGIFVAPGALGLAAGTLWPWLLPWFCAAALIAVAAMLVSGRGEAAFVRPAPARVPWGAVAALTLAVAVRAIGGCAADFPWKTGAGLSFLTAIFVFAGKSIGGYACDRLGPTRTALASVPAAALLTAFCAAWAAPALAGQLLLNLSMPVTLWLIYRAMPDSPGFAFGLAASALWPGTVAGMLINLSGAWNRALILVSFAAGLAAIIYAEKSLKEVRT